LEGASADTPASQTLIVMSTPHETIFEPSGEKPTDATLSLCAFSFSALSSREAVASTGVVRLGLHH
jgi:hypothetical protein